MHRRCLFKFKQSLVMMTKWWYSYSSIHTHQYLDHANTWNIIMEEEQRNDMCFCRHHRQQSGRVELNRWFPLVGILLTDRGCQKVGVPSSPCQTTNWNRQLAKLYSTASTENMIWILKYFPYFFQNYFRLLFFLSKEVIPFSLVHWPLLCVPQTPKITNTTEFCDLYQNIWRDIYVNTNKISVNLLKREEI